MRYPEGHKGRTRERILDAAGRVFRQQGYAGGGLGDVMGAAGLTKGGFYAHFNSKEDLFAQMLTRELGRGYDHLTAGDAAARLSGPPLVGFFIDRYLSPGHVTASGFGCPLPSLLGEIGRTCGTPATAFAAYLDCFADRVAPHLPPDDPDPRGTAVALLAAMVGGLATARATGDTEQTAAVLAGCRAGCRRLARIEEPAHIPTN